MTFTTPPVPVVVDASVAVGAVSGEPDAMRIWKELGAQERMLLAPTFVWTEIATALLRGRRYAAIDVDGRLAALAGSGLQTTDGGFDGLRGVLALAERHALSVYDAAYLWIAVKVDGELATLDRALARAAEAEGVPLVFAA